MRITSELGQEIIERFSKNIEINLDIMNLEGRIVASTDPKRINKIHSDAMKAIENKKEISISKDDVNRFQGIKQGWVLPIKHHGKINGVIGIWGSPEEVKGIAKIIQVSVEITLEQIFDQSQVFFKERQWNNWLHQLLSPSRINLSYLDEVANYSLNINTNNEWKIIVLSGDNVQDILEMVRKEIHEAGIEVLFISPFKKKEIVIALPQQFSNIDLLVQRLFVLSDRKIQIGIGEKKNGIMGLRNSYFQAKQALFFLNKSKGISFIKNWKIERLIAAIKESEFQLICKEYEQLLNEMGNEYINTIDTYFKMNLNLKETATILHIHRNTLLYRLNQIKMKVGLDPRIFNESIILKIIRGR